MSCEANAKANATAKAKAKAKAKKTLQGEAKVSILHVFVVKIGYCTHSPLFRTEFILMIGGNMYGFASSDFHTYSCVHLRAT